MDLWGKKERERNKHGILQRLSSYGLFFTLPPFSLPSKKCDFPLSTASLFQHFPFEISPSFMIMSIKASFWDVDASGLRIWGYTPYLVVSRIRLGVWW